MARYARRLEQGALSAPLEIQTWRGPAAGGMRAERDREGHGSGDIRMVAHAHSLCSRA